MKLSNQRLLGIMQFFNVLQMDGTDKEGNPVVRKLPVKLGFAVRKNRKAVDSHLEDYEEARKELLKEHCKLDKKGEIVADVNGHATFTSDKSREAFATKHLDLLTTKSEVVIHKVTESEIEKMGSIEEHILAGLEFMIEGWEEPEEEVHSNGQIKEEADA